MEAFGTVLASIIALSFGLYEISRSRRNSPKIVIDLFRKENMLCMKIGNKGLSTAYGVNLRLNQFTVEETNPFDEETRVSEVKSIGNLQNNEYETIRIFSIAKLGGKLYLQGMNVGKTKAIPFSSKIDVKYRVTGDNFPAKKISYRISGSMDSKDQPVINYS
ncbi:MAG: hypothetical protein ACTSXD_01065 [Candidatus Heimdallarchaeaceae archaeon]